MSHIDGVEETEWCFPVRSAGGWAEVRVRQNGDVVFTHGERAGEWLLLDGISYPTKPIDLTNVPAAPALPLNDVDLSHRGANFLNDRFVYHYTSARKALELILPEKRLRMSPYRKLNDPRESKEWAFAIVSPVGALAPGDALKLSAEISSNIKDTLRVLCFSTDGSPVVADSTDLTRASGWNHPNMWNHYADEYRGVVLAFDRRKLLANAKLALAPRLNLFFGHVMYLDSSSMGANLAFMLDYGRWRSANSKVIATQHLLQWGGALCFVKHSAWSTEQECRVIATGASVADEYVPIDGALAEVIVGSEADNATYDGCKAAAMALGAGVSVSTWRNGQGFRVPTKPPKS